MADGTLITLISVGVTFLFMLGVPVFLVIASWVVGCSYVLGLTLDNMGAELFNVFNKGFALLAMPLFIILDVFEKVFENPTSHQNKGEGRSDQKPPLHHIVGSQNDLKV